MLEVKKSPGLDAPRRMGTRGEKAEPYDLEGRKLEPSTARKYKLLERRMKEYGEDRGLTMLAQFNLAELSGFRATWKDGPRTASRKLERLRAFFRFCLDRHWVESNPAAKIKPPKTSLCPNAAVA